MAIEDQRNFKQPQSGGAAQRLGGVAPSVAPRATAINQIPGAEIKAPPSDGRQSSELSRNLNNAANALGGMGAVASVPLRAGQAASKLAQQASGTQLLAGTATKAAPAADFISGMGSGATTYANTIPRLGNAPTTTLPGVNAALQEGAQANAMAAATRLGAGAGAGANALDNGRPRDAIQPAAAPKQAQPPAQEPPSARGLYFADRAQDMSNRWNSGDYAGAIGSGVRTAGEGLGVSALSVTDSLTQPWRNAAGRAWDGLVGNQPNTSATAAASQSAAARLSEKPNQPAATQAAGAPEQTAAAALPNAQPSQINYDAATNTYSGTNVGANAQIVNGRGGGAISAQNMQAANELAADQNLASVARLASTGNVPQTPQRGVMLAPTVAHSGNDFSARKRLENLRTSASSIKNDPRWGGRRNGQNPSEVAYMQALQADLAAQGKQPDLDMQTMGLNAGMAREQMQQVGANTRAAMGERTAAQRLAMEGRRLAGEEETRGFQSRQAQRLEDAQDAYFDAKTDEARGTARNRLTALTGKSEERNLSNNFMKRKVPTLDKEGRVVGEQEELVDLRTGAPLGASSTGNTPVKVTTPEQLNALPAGSVYVGPDGKQYQKG